jgi:hypothetical protein
MRRTITALFAMAALAAPTLADDPVAIGEIGFGQALLDKADEYGQRELDYLAREMREDLERELAGMLGENGLTLQVTILDATPNRPTMQQMGAHGLHHSSISIGGASLEAELVDAGGNTLETFSYSWRSYDIRNVVGYSRWTDARRAMNRFASDVGESLAERNATAS